MAGKSFTIPTIYTAVDRLSPTLRRMETQMGKFEASLNRQERMFNRLSPSIGNAAKQLLSYATAGAAIAGVAFSGKAIMDFETAIADLSAITGVSGEKLEVFKKEIFSVADATKESSIEVAKAFTNVGNNAPKLLENAAALAEVSKQSIILAQASRMELAPSAEYLTSIMNQFDLAPDKAKRVGDLLAQGLVIGSQSIEGTAMALSKFGAVAKNAGIPIEDAIASVQIISNKLKDPEIAGRQLKQSFLRMQKLGELEPKALQMLARAKVDMKIAANNSLPLVERLQELKKLLKTPGGVAEVFNTENVQAMIPLLEAADRFSSFKGQLVSGSENKMLEMAAKNTGTLAYAVKQLGNAWITYITGSDKVNSGLEKLKNLTHWVTRNLDGIVTVLTTYLGLMAAWWAILKVARIAMIGYNIALALNVLLTGRSVMALRGNAIALTIVSYATKAATAAQWLFNAATAAHPLLIWAAAVTAAVGLMQLYRNRAKSMTEVQRNQLEIGNKVLANTIDQRTEVMILFETLRKTQQGTDKYNESLAKLEEMQPGITKQYALHLKYLGNINQAEKDLTDSIIKRATVQAATELATQKFSEALQRKEAGVTFSDMLKSALFARSGKTSEDFMESDVKALNRQGEWFVNQAAVLNAGATNGNVAVDINAPVGWGVKAASDSNQIKVNVIETNKYNFSR